MAVLTTKAPSLTSILADSLYLRQDQNLSDISNIILARAALGLGSAALSNIADFATAAQGALADTALQPSAIGSTIQGYDPTLAALALLTGTADKIAYFDGSETMALTGLSAFGRSLIDDADAAAARTTLGLVAGGAGDIWVRKAGDTMTGALNISVGAVPALGLTTAVAIGDQAFSYTNSSILRTEILGSGSQIWYLNSGSGEVGRIEYSTPTSVPGILFFNSSGTGRSQIKMIDSSGGFSLGATTGSGIPAGLFFVYTSGEAGVENGKFYTYRDDVAGSGIAEFMYFQRRGGSPAVGYGIGINFIGKSSTTDDRAMAHISTLWNVATDASRVADMLFEAGYSGGYTEFLRGRGGSSPLIGFLGATPIARPTSYTLDATATRTMPTPEVAFTGQDNLQVGSVYAKSADLITLQTRLNNVEGVLRQLIIDLASTSGYGLLVAS